MEVSKHFLLVALGCAIVTWLPRVFPFIFSRKLTFPKWLNDFLSFIPMCILTALFIQNMLVARPNQLPAFHLENILASIPTIGVAIYTKNLMLTVLVGILSMAVLRFFL